MSLSADACEKCDECNRPVGALYFKSNQRVCWGCCNRDITGLAPELERIGTPMPALPDQRPRTVAAGAEPFGAAVLAECLAVADMLIEKNKAYGNSALNPVRIFSRADPVEQLRVRIDDKLSRLARGSDAGEDVIKDLIGYLVVLRLAMARETK